MLNYTNMYRHSFTLEIETDNSEFDKTLDDSFQFEQTLKLKSSFVE